MFMLLNWRLWALGAIVAFFALTHFSAYRAGKQNVRTQWDLSIATANSDARKLEQQRQRIVIDAAKAATKRRVVIAADAGTARHELDSLRHALITPSPASDNSCPAADSRAPALRELLEACGRAYQELAEKADGHVSDVKMLLEAWPQK